MYKLQPLDVSANSKGDAIVKSGGDKSMDDLFRSADERNDQISVKGLRFFLLNCQFNILQQLGLDATHQTVVSQREGYNNRDAKTAHKAKVFQFS